MFIEGKFHHKDTEVTKRRQNKIRRLHRLRRFRFRTSAGRQERKETAVLIMSSTRVTCESPVEICVICEICGLYLEMSSRSPFRPLAGAPFRPVAVSLLYRRPFFENTNCAVTFVAVTSTTRTSEAVQASWIR